MRELTDDEKLELMILLEEEKKQDAVRYAREKLDLNLQMGVIFVKDFAKQEMGLDILTFANEKKIT